MMGTKFETEMQVRPDDIDMNQHVHASRYMDYVLAARYDQMARCYQMAMEEFLQLGFGWFVSMAQIEYKRPLGLGDHFIVRTWVAEILKRGVKVAQPAMVPAKPRPPHRRCRSRPSCGHTTSLFHRCPDRRVGPGSATGRRCSSRPDHHAPWEVEHLLRIGVAGDYGRSVSARH